MNRHIKILILGPFFFLRRNWRITLGLLLLMAVLTIMTQVGGVILWCALPILDSIRHRVKRAPRIFCCLTFLVIYLVIIAGFLPVIAPVFGRVPLPWFTTQELPLRPVNMLYCIMARNYVQPQLKTVLEEVAVNMAEHSKDTPLIYLDANFPFINGFPLLPHLSHHDGKKVDLAFFYRDAESKIFLPNPPSPIGYWVYEQPQPNEPQPCQKNPGWLRWNFEWLQPFFASAELDPGRTRKLLELLAKSRQVQKILLEPHLKTRLRLSSQKIRFQGCNAARHDDHVHIQIW